MTNSSAKKNYFKRLWRVGSIAILFLVIFFVTGEVALRILFFDGASFNSHSGPIVQRFERNFVFNKYDGPSRGPQINDSDDSIRNRIVVQGDSITWGQAVKDEQDVYSELLLADLNSSGESFDMAVLARPGREIDGHLEQIKKWGADLEPDIILYQWYVNDLEIEKTKRPKSLKPWRYLFFAPTLSRVSYLWWYLDYGLSVLNPPKQSYASYLSQNFADDSYDWLIFENVFVEWARQAKELSPNIMVVLYPRLSLAGDERPELPVGLTDIYSRMLALCFREGFECLDLTDRMMEVRKSSDLAASDFDTHPSVLAHSIIADELAKRIRRAWPHFFQKPAQHSTQ